MANEVNENVTTNEEVTYDVVPATEQKYRPSKVDYCVGGATVGLAIVGVCALFKKGKEKFDKWRAKKRGEVIDVEPEELEEVPEEQ